MTIQKLRLVNFRCHQHLDLEFVPGLNILFGKNGTGKTSILEAIHYAARLKSHRTALSREMIRAGTKEFLISLTTTKGLKITVQKTTDQRTLRHDTEQVAAQSHYGTLPVVILSSEDLELVTAGDSKRRAFLNSLLAHQSEANRQLLIRYTRLLQQRAEALRAPNPDILTLQLLAQQMEEVGRTLQKQRAKLTRRVSLLAAAAYRKLTAGREHLRIQITPASWEANINQEILQRRNLIGLQRDQIHLIHQDRDPAKFASEGQQRGIAIALKVAEYIIIRKVTGSSPILLLDDIQKELDPERMLMGEKLLEETPQVIMARTYLIPTESVAKIHHIS